MTRMAKWNREEGVALVATLLVLMLVSALMAGAFAAIQSDLRDSATDRDQTQAYAAAHAGLEQLTSSLAQVFMTDVSPSVSQITALTSTPPSIPGFTYSAPGSPGTAGDTSGFTIDYVDTEAPIGQPDVLSNMAITSGPFTGFIGLITPYTMTVTARSSTGKSEVRLRRSLQTVAVPVFQFGMFSETDLSILAGGGFRFGGRVHTNGNLFVAAQTNASPAINVTFSDRITAVGEVIRNYLANGLLNSTTAPSFNNEVRIPTSTATTDVLRQSPNMGSVATMPGSAPNPSWFSISTGTFNSYVRTAATGATRLDLPLVSQGAQPIDLIRRPRLNSAENVANARVFAQRFFSQASLRILLSDRQSDITDLPTVTATAPVRLDGPDGAAGNWTVAPPAGYGPVDATHPPIARAIGPAFTTTHPTQVSLYTAAGSWTQIYVPDAATGIPDVYKLPANLSIFSPAGVFQQFVFCAGKTGPQAVAADGTGAAIAANVFHRCSAGTPAAPVALAAIPVGSTVQATIDGRLVTATIGTAVAAGTNMDLPVGAGQTAPFSPDLLWINNPNAAVANTATPVSCQGYSDTAITKGGATLRRFLNCRGLTAAPAINIGITTSSLQARDTGTIGGFIKIEKQDGSGTWTDVTMEILNLGIGAPNSGGAICADPTPNAVLRIQRLRDNRGACDYAQSQNSYDWWPQGLFDAREGSVRDAGTGFHNQTSPMMMSGVMQYVALDVGNLKRWLSGAIGATGNTARNDNGDGFIVYFSDRRGNHDPGNADEETGEYGYEDFVNSTTGNGAPDSTLQAGEDVNAGDPRWPANSQQRYGANVWNDPSFMPTGPVPAVANSLYTVANAHPWTVIPIGNTALLPGAGQALVNKQLLFRRALKVVNGGITGGVNSLPDAGLTIATENPVYVHGNYNADETAPNDTWGNMEPNRPAAIIADAISLLSRNWSDALSFEAPNAMWSRAAATTSYRFAAIAGKGLSFPYCGAACGNPGHLFGTDGGAANFFRLLENWSAPGAAPEGIRYRGSIISLHVNRQAVGAFKFAAANNHIYNGGPRNFTYDADFLIPDELPPGTPMFRDINTLQFRQILRPNQ